MFGEIGWKGYCCSSSPYVDVVYCEEGYVSCPSCLFLLLCHDGEVQLVKLFLVDSAGSVEHDITA